MESLGSSASHTPWLSQRISQLLTPGPKPSHKELGWGAVGKSGRWEGCQWGVREKVEVEAKEDVEAEADVGTGDVRRERQWVPRGS